VGSRDNGVYRDIDWVNTDVDKNKKRTQDSTDEQLDERNVCRMQ
jgi:hypothetical protein